MEDEQEEEEEEAEQLATSPSDLGGVPWKEAVELHAKLRGNQEGEGEGGAGVDTVSRDGEVEEEEDDDEEDEEEDEEEDDEEDEDSSEGIFLRTFPAFFSVCLP